MTWLEGDLTYRRSAPTRWQVSTFERAILDNAAAARFGQRSSSQPLLIHDGERAADLNRRHHPAEVAELLEDQAWDRRPAGALHKSVPRRGSIIAVR